LALILAALFCQRRWTRGGWQLAARIGLVAMVPALPYFSILAYASYGNAFDEIRLDDGRRFVVAGWAIRTDAIYDLYEQTGPLGLYWRRVGMLDYSEDDGFAAGAHLSRSRDDKWLAFARGGLFVDCFAVKSDGLKPCPAGRRASWTDPDFEAGMRLRSARIAALTGMRP
jgi:hypothetical protein